MNLFKRKKAKDIEYIIPDLISETPKTKDQRLAKEIQYSRLSSLNSPLSCSGACVESRSDKLPVVSLSG